jgi:2-amino-4-hydroxy-6-hydroxymethyldihydropteridine diphosphokinase
VTGLRRLGEVRAVSPLYETEPIGGSDQGAYLNAVVVLEAALPARELLDGCLAIEARRGRERRERWGPRTLDIDLLLFGGEVHAEPGLTVPHPRLTQRRFVLEPLLDAWPEAALPDGTPLAGFVEAVAGQEVEQIDAGEWWTAD